MSAQLMKNCKQCFTEMIRNKKYSYKQWADREYCSFTCAGKNKIPNMDRSVYASMKDKKHSEMTKIKMSIAHSNENNYSWKGQDVSYSGLHKWVNRKKGKPQSCSKCLSTKNLVWANISHKYKRDLEDFIGLCQSCNLRYDYGHISL